MSRSDEKAEVSRHPRPSSHICRLPALSGVFQLESRTRPLVAAPCALPCHLMTVYPVATTNGQPRRSATESGYPVVLVQCDASHKDGCFVMRVTLRGENVISVVRSSLYIKKSVVTVVTWLQNPSSPCPVWAGAVTKLPQRLGYSWLQGGGCNQCNHAVTKKYCGFGYSQKPWYIRDRAI